MNEHEKNVIIEVVMEMIESVRRCVQSMMGINQNVEMEW